LFHLAIIVDGEIVSTPEVFRRKYSTTWLCFDLLSALPFGLSSEVADVGNALVLLRLLHLPFYLTAIKSYLLDHGFSLLNKPLRRLVLTIFLVLIMAHITGSIFTIFVESNDSSTLDYAFYRMENLDPAQRVRVFLRL
jgi:C4-dicarboxylate transporter